MGIRVPESWRWSGALIAFALLFAATGAPVGSMAADPPRALARFEAEIKSAVAKVRPSTVNINAVGVRWLDAPGGGGGPREAVPYRSIGTGVLVDQRGYVLTNAHVVGHATSISVKLWRASPNDFSGKVVHRDEQLDLALVKLEGSGSFPAAAFGGGAEVGQWVIALGSPYGLQHSVSMGIVSDRSRDLWINGHMYKQLIQTDAAINQGNSGGPLIDLRGEVIGISTAIYAPDGVSAGVGFAIPAARVRAFLSDVLPGAAIIPAAAKFEKEPIKPGAKAPHPPMGKCGKCHTFITPPPKIATTIAFPMEGPRPELVPAVKPPPRGHARDPKDDWRVIQRAAALMLAAAVVFNMLGLGGGFFYVPILLLFGVDFHTASSTSLFIIMVAHISALAVFLKKGLIDYKLALVLEPVTCVGAFLGGLSSQAFGDQPLSLLFGVILLGTAYLMNRSSGLADGSGSIHFTKWRWRRSFGPHEYSVDLPVGLPAAFAVGFLGGMLGFAGGVIKVPMMVLMFGVPFKVAIATSCLMVTLTSMVGCLGHSIKGDFDLYLSLGLALAAVVGAQIGARLTLRADKDLLKRMFAVMLLVVAVWMIVRVF